MFKGKLIELPQLQRPPLIYETTLPFNDYLFIPPLPTPPFPLCTQILSKTRKHEILFKFPKKKKKNRVKGNQRNPELQGGWGGKKKI